MIGTYYLVRDLLVSTGALVGALLWKLGGPNLNFAAATVLGAIGTVYYLISLQSTSRRGVPA